MSFGFGFGFPRRLTSGGGLSPSLYLDFVGTGVLPSTVTFSRGTNATLTDSNGRIAWAPHNLLTNSEDFEAAGWTKSGLNTTGTPPWVNVAVAPDGTTTAERLIEDNSTGTHQIYVLPGLGINTYTRTIYAKANGRTQFELTQESGGNARFTLTGAGTAVALGSNTVSIQALDNGWYRCSSTFTVTGIFGLYLVLYNGSTTNYTGDGTSGLFIWGAQLNVGSTAQSYNSTTPKNLLGFTQEPENAAWTKSNSYVQQNLLTWSQDFDNGWTLPSSGATITPNTTIAPDGTITADTLTATATTARHEVFRTSSTTTANQPITGSAFIKQNTNQYAYIVIGSNGIDSSAWAVAVIDLATGVITQTSNGATASAVSSSRSNVGSGWYRVSVTMTMTATDTFFGIYLSNTATPTLSFFGALSYTAVGTESVFLWGAQLVQGSTAGDYTQTTSAAAPTRYLNWDGTLTGRKLVESATGGVHVVYASTAVAAVPYTLSMYAKPEERNFARLDFVTSSYAAGSTVILNLTTGVTTVTNYGATTGTTATAVSVGGGWYRLTMTVQATAATYFSQIGLSSTNSTGIYTGDGTSGIYVSDFQLSNSASVDPYVYNPQAAAASAAYYGPRFDYDPVTLASRGLLIEEQRTNLFVRSEEFDVTATWTPLNLTVTANTDTAPNGTLSADTLTATAANAVIQQAASVTNAAVYTYSVWIKRKTGTGAVTLSDLNGNYFSVTVDATWTRFSLTSTAASTTGRGYIRLTTSGDEVYVWGAQLEAGSFATSYIPTVASQVTRNADSASMLGDNFYTWYNPNQGTLSGEGDAFALLAATSSNTFFSINDGTANNYQSIYTFGNNGYAATVTGGAVQANPGVTTLTLTANQVYKAVYAYQVNNFGYTVNGATVVTDTLGSVPTATQANIGSRITASSLPLNGHIRRINYYNTRLDNATLQALTV